jgi:UDP-glucose 4-epimerase
VNFLVTGAAGFVGSNLSDRLLHLGHDVVGYDNFSTGQPAFIEQALRSPRYRLVHADLLDRNTLAHAMDGVDFVFHLAANADVRFGTQHRRRDLEQNTIATWNVLESMYERGVRRIAFSSTGSIYGEPSVFPTPESCPFPVQTSLYGASKLAAEGLIQAYSEACGMQAYIFRFVSILGERYSHGHVFDFYKQLLKHPDTLHVLGNGKQRKSYLYVQDCIDAMLLAVERADGRLNVFNLGTDEYCEVNDSVRWICDYLGVKPRLIYSGGERGWIGDSPFIFLDCCAIRSLGWSPRLGIQEAVIRTVEFLECNPSVQLRTAELPNLQTSVENGLPESLA